MKIRPQVIFAREDPRLVHQGESQELYDLRGRHRDVTVEEHHVADHTALWQALNRLSREVQLLQQLVDEE